MGGSVYWRARQTKESLGPLGVQQYRLKDQTLQIGSLLAFHRFLTAQNRRVNPHLDS
jgi:hypothetical protein